MTRFSNLKAIPLKLNSAKSAKLTDQEVKLPRRLNQEKLMPDTVLKAMEKAFG